MAITQCQPSADREDFTPTLVRLVECEGSSNQFVDISLDEAEAFDLACQK